MSELLTQKHLSRQDDAETHDKISYCIQAY